ncbi:methyl-accepting chemotaxis protein [Neobacillus sp. D3-1R]|uniref:methyl-accepting chemotaxis protein n=1 Tax=Neobacillus sp. D3-1R TaxID=3445778 RepID=UPI003F9F2EAD
MSLKSRFILMFVAMFLVFFGTTTTSLLLFKSNLSKDVKQSDVQMAENTNVYVKSQLSQLATSIGNNLVKQEEVIDQSMLNAAYVVQNLDQQKPLTNEDLAKLAKQTNMTDIYLTDKEGIFTTATEQVSIGTNLFSIWDGYKMLLNGEATVLPSTLKVKVETGEIFKFMAIPRYDQKGIIETAINSSDIELLLSKSIQPESGVKQIYLVDNFNTVLTESLADGEKSEWKKGSQIENSTIKQVFDSKKPQISIDGKQGKIYYPIIDKQSNVPYVLYINLDTTPYAKNSDTGRDTLQDIEVHFTETFYIILIVLVAMSVLIIGGTAWYVGKHMNRLTRLKDSAIRISQGDLSFAEAVEKESKDEIGQLRQAFLVMKNNLVDMITRLKETSSQVASSSEELIASSEQTSQAAESITVTIQEVATGTEKQTVSVSQGVEVIHQMSHEVEQVSANAQMTATLSEEAFRKTIDGSQIVSEALKQMESIFSKFATLSSAIDRMNNRSKEVEKIIDVIGSIADQTNLLALNAAIEAARAGEHGKGFAVVADEVRKLAEQSGASTKQIAQLITTIQSDTVEVVNEMDSGKEELNKGLTVVERANELFVEIKNVLHEVNAKIVDVSQSSAQISTNTRKVVDSVTTIAEISGVVAEGTQTVSAATEEQLATMEEISASAVALSKLALELEEMIQEFKL